MVVQLITLEVATTEEKVSVARHTFEEFLKPFSKTVFGHMYHTRPDSNHFIISDVELKLFQKFLIENQVNNTVEKVINE